ncbi:DUF6624 domain-containing protein [Chryseobacterium daecheongense]|uniref:Uncharacterized protein n=1 Tax=Chryseobacterium daecheongense TaxID=192389 RepID=A0A3N0VY90_9FLAO|nr:DUF6624 domain-containing protein [Chryseobacterium daecheongense]ROH97707.1 hypothetical protein EGI05_10035 [Chryseobacterium daecheongense]TDX93132.1 hypothetical protein BCF50_2089 [Chryseobacterium daecheongense]
MNTKFSEELIRLAKKDLQVRERLLSENKLSDGYHPEMEKIHKENARHLRHIIEQIGFPTISKVGKEASEAAWLIIQHSISDPEFMKSSYQMMFEHQSDINLKHLAFLFDRIQFFQGKPQKFGTQLNSDGSIYPVINKDEINELRKKHLLPELSQKEIDKILPIEQIESIESQNPDYIAWRQKVGWK